MQTQDAVTSHNNCRAHKLFKKYIQQMSYGMTRTCCLLVAMSVQMHPTWILTSASPDSSNILKYNCNQEKAYPPNFSVW